MNYNELANLLFPDIITTVNEIEEKYPKRNLKEGAIVTRFAPSPTGFLHIGGLYGALIDERLAHLSGGIFYLRIEDTDQKREIEGAVELLINNFKDFGVVFDEGAVIDGDNGNYGPYRQRQRENIYKTFAKQLVSEGKAYPCFCSEEQLSLNHSEQEQIKANFGYYGQWAKHRDFSLEEIKKELNNGKSFVLRLKSNGNAKNIIKIKDLIKGELQLYENDQDIVLLKSDGIPTYHFAHILDDYLMGTTHIVRGEEWLSTFHWHLQLFEAIGKEPPKYLHTAHIMKNEDGAKRKLSKRKDPESAVSYYKENGYPAIAVNEYLMTLLNSNFEEWKRTNPTLSYKDFPFSIKKISVSGSLFDLLKLRDISKNIIANMTTSQIVTEILNWAKEFDAEFYKLLNRDINYTNSIFAIGRGVKKPRKDIACFSEVKNYCSFFFDELFQVECDYPENISKQDVTAILQGFSKVYDINDDNSLWFSKVKEIASSLGFASETKDYRENPSAFKGSVADVSMVIRIAITGRQNSPDLHTVMQILGKERAIFRMRI